MGLPGGGAGSEGGQEGPARPDICGDPVPGAAAAGAETFSAAGRAEHKCGWFIAPLGMSEPPLGATCAVRGSRPDPRAGGQVTSRGPRSTVFCWAGLSQTRPSQSHQPALCLWWCLLAFVLYFKWDKLNRRNGTGCCKGTGGCAALAVRRDRRAADTVLRWESGGLF